MTVPLAILAFFAVALGFLGTPVWPWFHDYFTGHESAVSIGRLFQWNVLSVLILSIGAVVIGVGAGWWFYGLEPSSRASDPDYLEELKPKLFEVLRNKFYVDELYDATVVRWNTAVASLADWLDRSIWNGIVLGVSYLVLGLSWVTRFFDEYVINLLFDQGCHGIGSGGRWTAKLQDGQVQHYLRVFGVALAGLLLLLIWGF